MMRMRRARHPSFRWPTRRIDLAADLLRKPDATVGAVADVVEREPEPHSDTATTGRGPGANLDASDRAWVFTSAVLFGQLPVAWVTA